MATVIYTQSRRNNLGEGLVRGAEQLADRRKLLEEEEKEAKRMERAQQFMQEFNAAPNRDTAIGLSERYPDMFEDAMDVKGLYDIVDRKFPGEEPTTTETVDFIDQETGAPVQMLVTEDQQRAIAEGTLDPSRLPGASGRRLAVGQGDQPLSYDFYNDRTGQFVGNMDLAEGQAQGYVTRETLDERRRRAEADREGSSSGAVNPPRDSVLKARAALQRQGVESPTDNQIGWEIHVMDELTAAQRSLAQTFGGQFDDGEIVGFKGPGDEDRYQTSVDLTEQMLRTGISRSRAVRYARSMVFDASPDQIREELAQDQGGAVASIPIENIPMAEGRPDGNAMREGAVYKRAGRYYLRQGNQIVELELY